MKDKQLFEGITAVMELDNEVAASCSGGVAHLFQDTEFRGRELTFYEGSADLSKYSFDNKTSSITISGGQEWAFYSGKNYEGTATILKDGSYPFGIYPNDSISSLRRIA